MLWGQHMRETSMSLRVSVQVVDPEYVDPTTSGVWDHSRTSKKRSQRAFPLRRHCHGAAPEICKRGKLFLPSNRRQRRRIIIDGGRKRNDRQSVLTHHFCRTFPHSRMTTSQRKQLLTSPVIRSIVVNFHHLRFL
jgi:hypothetical protein